MSGAGKLLAPIALAFAGVGVAVAFAGTGPMFATWRTAAADSFYGTQTLPPELAELVGLTLGILGGSIAGKWVAAWAIARRYVQTGAPWMWRALVAGLLAWFAVDSGFSLGLDASFNVAMINVLPLVVFGIPLWLARPGREDDGRKDEPSPAMPLPWKVLFATCVVFVIVGALLLGTPVSPLFAPYLETLAETYFEGGITHEAYLWIRFSYGLIGVTFGAHFLMLAWAVLRAPGQRWVLDAVALSMLAWFVVDSTACLRHGGLFNVLMINVPSMLAVTLPWAWSRRRA